MWGCGQSASFCNICEVQLGPRLEVFQLEVSSCLLQSSAVSHSNKEKAKKGESD